MTGNGQGTLWGKKQNTKPLPCANSKDWKSLKEEALSPTGRGRDAGWKVLWRRKTTAVSTVRQALASAVTLLAPEKIIKF